MKDMMQKAIQPPEELGMLGSRSNVSSSVEIQVVRSETDRSIAALELGLSEDAPWERIDRLVEADSIAWPRYRR